MKNLSRLVEQFAFHVKAQEQFTQEGNPHLGNEHAKKYIAAFKELKGIGDDGREALSALLAHPDRDVRSAAAAFLLRYKHEKAKAVLEDVARGNDLTAFSAEQALKRWAEGTWQLDLEDG